MKQSYDVLIIGCGLSGLAAGIRLCYAGKSVCILEKHTLPGGLNSFYKQGGYQFDVGLHALTNFCEKKSNRRLPLQRVLRQLKIDYDSLDLVQQTQSSINFPSNILIFNNDIELLVAEVAREFPQQVDRFRKLIHYINDIYIDPLEEKPFQSTREYLKQFITEPLFIEMLLTPIQYYGSAIAHDIDFPQFCIIFKSIFIEGFCRPRLGMKNFLQSLVKKFKEDGGELRYNSSVTEIVYQGNRASGVMTEKYGFIEAKKIISSIGKNETQILLKKIVSSSPKNFLGFVETIFVVDKKPEEISSIDKSIQFINRAEKFSFQSPKKENVNLSSAVLCCPQKFDYPRGTFDKTFVRLTHLANTKTWFELNDNDYQRAKQDFITKQKQLYLSTDIVNSIVYTDAFTPRTVYQYTGHQYGAIYGNPDKIKNAQTQLSNLFICGTDQGMLGIVGSMLSGIAVVNSYTLY